MTKDRLTDTLTIGLGILYAVAGIAETIRAVDSGDGGIPFWFGTLVGGGTAILLGILVFRGRPRVYAALVVAGAAAGMLATMWTLVIPILAIAVIVLTLQRTSEDSAPAA